MSGKIGGTWIEVRRDQDLPTGTGVIMSIGMTRSEAYAIRLGKPRPEMPFIYTTDTSDRSEGCRWDSPVPPVVSMRVEYDTGSCRPLRDETTGDQLPAILPPRASGDPPDHLRLALARFDDVFGQDDEP